MAQKSETTYTIAGAAALTGLHKNTIRMRVKLGQLEAERFPGKFGQEYRIHRIALIHAGLLPPDEPLPAPPISPPITPTVSPPDRDGDTPRQSPDPQPGSVQIPLLDLLQRHEQSMYRLGWLEAELARHKALAEHAESLQEAAREREQELRELRRELERAQERNREIEELRALVRDMEQETERMHHEVERHRTAASRRWWHALLGRRGL